ncbi:YdcF family protein [Vibrio aestuarianus]|uniref:YdcF family protein n=1 Tax=Vibrio aestuarianus TaxID=28171 RepID=A0A7X6N6C0_9VIBR|nr:YdcF family protein [Vibrio aestuarianus]MDE1225466.1 YdcF family protein [Vibrio aestuarianus]MDE1263174.1 YdcF family protein [Vibrio aestuarianus]MDE1297155.1 YdcF family protein [Vibrio aestuarianus]MDE1311284.1 YdcF family protein [Vibrio aestuarianus]MDE1327443.1 YdcF family protein [Vibrio aestuarianus]
MSKHLYQHIETLWQYMQMGQQLSPADIILVFCSNDIRVAEYAASLYHQKLAPYLMFSGGQGRFTEGLFDKSEAETFAAIAKDAGVPSEHILLETHATNSGENVLLTHELLQQKSIQTQRIILVQKPFMERRAFATFEKQWPEHYQSLVVTSTGESFFDYLNEEFTLDVALTALLEDFSRIKTYPEQGFQTKQIIPDEVEQAYHALLRLNL